jgi:type VI secretion system protein VasI
MTINKFAVTFLVIVSFVLGVYIGKANSLPNNQQNSTPEKQQVKITFTSDPTNSVLYIDGKMLGSTPHTATLEKGKEIKYQIKAQETYEEYDLYKTYDGVFTATENTTVDIWLDRTTKEEQEIQMAAFQEKQKRAEEKRIAEEQEKLRKNSRWNIYTETNAIDDTTTVTLATTSLDALSTYGDPIRLLLRCQSGEVDAFIQWEDYLGLDETSVTYRVGTSSAKTDEWIISTNNKSTFFSRSENANRQFAEKLLNSDNGQFIAQVTPYGENPQVATFDISGLSFFIDALFEPCGGR